MPHRPSLRLIDRHGPSGKKNLIRFYRDLYVFAHVVGFLNLDRLTVGRRDINLKNRVNVWRFGARDWLSKLEHIDKTPPSGIETQKTREFFEWHRLRFDELLDMLYTSRITDGRTPGQLTEQEKGLISDNIVESLLIYGMK